MQPLQTFDELKDGELIISPIDCEVTRFHIDEGGDKYLDGFLIYQFSPSDFYVYTGTKDVGEKDEDYIDEVMHETKEER